MTRVISLRNVVNRRYIPRRCWSFGGREGWPIPSSVMGGRAWCHCLPDKLSNSSAVARIMSLRQGSFDWAAQFRQYLARSKSISERAFSRGGSFLLIRRYALRNHLRGQPKKRAAIPPAFWSDGTMGLWGETPVRRRSVCLLPSLVLYRTAHFDCDRSCRPQAHPRRSKPSSNPRSRAFSFKAGDHLVRRVARLECRRTGQQQASQNIPLV
jgi:hypothetical protein